jgi:hypothetical protein
MAIYLMGVPKGQIIQTLTMILAILSTKWNEPMFVQIKAEDPAHIVHWINLCSMLLPAEFCHEPAQLFKMLGKTVLVTSWKKNLSLLDEIYENVVKGEMGFLGVLPATHPSSSSHATITEDLGIDSSEEFDILDSYVKKTNLVSIKEFLNQYVPRVKSCLKYQTTYREICSRNWGFNKIIGVRDSAFSEKINSLMGDPMSNITMHGLLRNVTRLNQADVDIKAFADIKDLAVKYNFVNEENLIVATELDYAIFSFMAKCTLKTWETTKLGFREKEIWIIEIIESYMKGILHDDPFAFESEIKNLSARKKADKIFYLMEDNRLQNYLLQDDTAIENALDKVGHHMNYEERTVCYKSLIQKGILKEVKLPCVAPRYVLARFDLLKDAKFHNGNYEKTLMLGAGDQEISSLQLSAGN